MRGPRANAPTCPSWLEHAVTIRRIPLTFFSMPFGLVGLGDVWVTVADEGGAPHVVGSVLFLLAALVWILVSLAYLRAAVTTRSLLDDLRDPVAAPFASLVVIVPMVLGAEGLYPLTHLVGRAAVDVFLTLTVLLGGWFTGQWMYQHVDLDAFHPGYYLPTVAGGLLAAASAAAVGQHLLGEVAFGLGMIAWLVLGSLMLGRLFFRPLPPPPLVPTLALEVGAPAIASLAYFALDGDQVDAFVAVLAGYGVLMALAQVRLLPVYVRLPFMPSSWAFAFSWAAVASAVIHWLNDLRPAGLLGFEVAVLVVVTGLAGGIALRTLIALAQRQLFPVQTPAAAQGGGVQGSPEA
jgi:tellurite resistance protein